MKQTRQIGLFFLVLVLVDFLTLLKHHSPQVVQLQLSFRALFVVMHMTGSVSIPELNAFCAGTYTATARSKHAQYFPRAVVRKYSLTSQIYNRHARQN
jgi:hypothetical protein